MFKPFPAPRRPRRPRVRATPQLTAVAALATLVATACAGDARPGGSVDTTVALLTSGSVADGAWNAGAYRGLLAIRDSLGFRTIHQQTTGPASLDEAFEALGSAGVDLVLAHGFEYEQAAARAASSYPEMTIVVSGGSGTVAGVTALQLGLERAGFLAGMAAAGLSERGDLGLVGAFDTPNARRVFDAFSDGARRVAPSVRVRETFTGSWEDPAAAFEASTALLAAGVDMIAHDLNNASLGVFHALRSARTDDVHPRGIGMHGPQHLNAPDVVVGSAMVDLASVFLRLAESWHAGGSLPSTYRAPAEAIEFEFLPSVAAEHPELVEALDRAKRDMDAGASVPPRP